MRVGVVTGSVSQLGGGLLDCVRSPALELSRRGVEQRVFALRDQQTEREMPGWAPLRPEVFATLGPRFVGFSPGLRRALMESDCELIHSQGIFLWISGHVNAWHRRTGKPYVVSPHGMLDPWALRNSRWKKRIAARLFEDRHLHEAACLHALNESEAEAMRAYGLRQPIAIIPNGVNLPRGGRLVEGGKWKVEGDWWKVESGRWNKTVNLEGGGEKETFHLPPSTSRHASNSSDGSPRRKILFLGRLHPKKGLAELIEAWAKTGQRKDWTLVIAGWGDPRYVESLKELARARGLLAGGGKWKVEGGADCERGQEGGRREVEGGADCERSGRIVAGSWWRVTRNQQHETRNERSNPSSSEPEGEICFVGPVFGEEKERLLANADGFVLPSHSEGMPVAVLEAWSYAVPVVMTAECNLPEGFQSGAAMEVKLGPTSGKLSLTEGLEKLVTMKEEERKKMGEKGRKLVEDRFTWPEVAGQFLETYKWILGETKSKPGFVRE